MLGAVIGDIIGSVYEFDPIKTCAFTLFTPSSHFTDDTILTIAVADALMTFSQGQNASQLFGQCQMTGGFERELTQLFVVKLKEWGRRYTNADYGEAFHTWLTSQNNKPYNSWGNGGAMRVSPCAWVVPEALVPVGAACRRVEKLAALSAAVTHSHPEGIKGAVETARAVWLMRRARAERVRDCHAVERQKEFLRKRSAYPLSQSLSSIRENYTADLSAQKSVPEALTAFLESTNYESAVRGAVSLGGDSDTQAAIAGAVAEAAYGIPENIIHTAYGYLDEPLRAVCERWRAFVKEI